MPITVIHENTAMPIPFNYLLLHILIIITVLVDSTASDMTCFISHSCRVDRINPTSAVKRLERRAYYEWRDS